MRVAIVMLLCCVPAFAEAQPALPALATNDAVISIGWAGSDHERPRYDSWRGSLLVGASVGHYWTDHLKTEVDASWSNPGKDEVYEDFVYQGGVTYTIADYRAHDIRIGATQIYQFGRNAWVHPYIGVGFDVVRRETAIDRVGQSRTVVLAPNRTVPVVIPPASERRTDVFGQGVIKSGLKLYATEKAFFNTELKFGIRRNVDLVVWKIGLGFDF
jgi:hypothetical protein